MCVQEKIMQEKILRGSVYWVDLAPYAKEGSSIYNNTRPCLVIQNNVGNTYSPTIIIAPITSRQTKSKLPTHTSIGIEDGFSKPSIIMLEQLLTINKSDIIDKNYICTLSEEKLKEVDKALMASVLPDCDIVNKKTLVKNEIDIWKKINDSIWLINDTTEKINEYTNNAYFKRTRQSLIRDLQFYCESCGIDYSKMVEKRIYSIRDKGLDLNGGGFYKVQTV